MSAATAPAGSARRRPAPARWLLVKVLRGYQLIVSPWITQQCRYYPCCSSYAVRAIEVHGALRGTGLAIRRLLRCHPWTPGGVDYVPGSPEARDFAEREAQGVAPRAADGTAVSAHNIPGAEIGAPSPQETVPCSTQS